MTAWITAEAAAERLGVKRATLYAYVSRGVLVRKRAPDGRGSLFDPAEIEKLVTRGRPRHPPGGAGLVIESAITEISGDRLSYRGQEATALAVTRTFEDVATLLWTGALSPPAHDPVPDSAPAAPHPVPPAWPARGPGSTSGRAAPGSAAPRSGSVPGAAVPRTVVPPAWRATAEAVAVGTAAQAALPAGALPLERLQVIVPALAATDPLRLHLDAPAVIAAARAMIAGMVACLPQAPLASPPAASPASLASLRSPSSLTSRSLGAWPGVSANDHEGCRDAPAGARREAVDSAPPAAGPPVAAQMIGEGIAARLWPALCPNPPTEGLLGALQAALVLLADHELAASTLAARVAASVRADPYAVVATGLGALGGPLHGGASLGAEGMLAAAATPADAPRVVGELLRRTGRVPGFGHFVYRAGDPRAVCLLGLVARAAPGSPRLAVADAILAEMRGRALPEPNIDFALAVLAGIAGMISGAGEAVFAVSRTAGWVAHALEEYARDVPLRPRAVYTGPPAG